jgi:electron transport complex protein RnfA
MSEYLILAFGAILAGNFVLSRFLGICPFLGVSKRLETAMGMSGAVVFVMTLAAAVTWLIQNYILVPFRLEALQTLVFILVIATLVQLVEVALRRFAPPLYRALGIYLPLITTNCAVLGAALVNIEEGYSFVESVVFGFSAAIGFTMAICVFAGVRERLNFADPPKAFRGFPLLLISAGLAAMAFSGFSGMKF